MFDTVKYSPLIVIGTPPKIRDSQLSAINASPRNGSAMKIAEEGIKLAGSMILSTGFSAGGAAAGALIGSTVPVVGTAIGAAIGAFAGGVIGAAATQKLIERREELSMGELIASGLVSAVSAGSMAVVAGNTAVAANRGTRFLLGAAKFISASEKSGLHALGRRAASNVAQGIIYRSTDSIVGDRDPKDILNPFQLLEDVFIGEGARIGFKKADLIAKRARRVPEMAETLHSKEAAQPVEPDNRPVVTENLLPPVEPENPPLVVTENPLPPKIEEPAPKGLFKEMIEEARRAEAGQPQQPEMMLVPDPDGVNPACGYGIGKRKGKAPPPVAIPLKPK